MVGLRFLRIVNMPYVGGLPALFTHHRFLSASVVVVACIAPVVLARVAARIVENLALLMCVRLLASQGGTLLVSLHHASVLAGP